MTPRSQNANQSFQVVEFCPYHSFIVHQLVGWARIRYVRYGVKLQIFGRIFWVPNTAPVLRIVYFGENLAMDDHPAPRILKNFIASWPAPQPYIVGSLFKVLYFTYLLQPNLSLTPFWVWGCPGRPASDFQSVMKSASLPKIRHTCIEEMRRFWDSDAKEQCGCGTIPYVRTNRNASKSDGKHWYAYLKIKRGKKERRKRNY